MTRITSVTALLLYARTFIILTLMTMSTFLRYMRYNMVWSLAVVGF